MRDRCVYNHSRDGLFLYHEMRNNGYEENPIS